jgi:hypothetical protein
VFGAMAKIPEGISEGKLHWHGAVEYCEDMDVVYNNTQLNTTRSFEGQYNRLKLAIALSLDVSSLMSFLRN